MLPRYLGYFALPKVVQYLSLESRVSTIDDKVGRVVSGLVARWKRGSGLFFFFSTCATYMHVQIPVAARHDVLGNTRHVSALVTMCCWGGGYG